VYGMKAAQDSSELDLRESSRLEGSKAQKSLSGPTVASFVSPLHMKVPVKVLPVLIPPHCEICASF
jgi:hypothetical protein